MNTNVIHSEEALKEILKAEKTVYSDKIYNYFDSLINLETTILDDTLDEDIKIELLNKDIFNAIAKYNIYNNLINKDLKLKENKRSISVYNNKTILSTYKYDVEYNCFPQNYLGDIILYNYRNDEEYKEQILLEILQNYEQFSKLSHRQQILQAFEESYQKIDNKKPLTKKELENLKESLNYYQNIVNKFNLQEDTFKEKFPYDVSKKFESKVLMKTYPYMTISETIKII